MMLTHLPAHLGRDNEALHFPSHRGTVITMNHKLLVSGVVLALLAVSMNASAHDITGGPAGESWTYDSLTSLSVPVGEPCTTAPVNGVLTAVIGILYTLPSPIGGPGGIIDTLLGANGCLFDPPLGPNQTLFALTLCESDSFLGSGIATPGHGGLCAMSTGHTQGATCTFAGKSNGIENDYDNDGTCGGFAWPPAASYWYTFELTDSCVGSCGDVAYQVGGITCSFDGASATVDMQYAMLVDGGHVTAFQNTPNETGTYTVTSASGPATDCDVGFIPLTYS